MIRNSLYIFIIAIFISSIFDLGSFEFADVDSIDANGQVCIFLFCLQTNLGGVS